MGPEFVIQRVIAAQGGTWFDEYKPPEDADKKKQLLPDEGLPMVKPEIVEHLEKDVHDPDSQMLLGTVRDYCSQKDKLHNQVKFILAKSRNNNPQTVHKAQEMRQAALTTWAQIQTEMSQKIKDDDRITEFDNGQRFFITLIGAENLPMQDQNKRPDSYATVMMRPIHLAEPKLDGRKTECEGCYQKTPFGKESCELHRSDWVPNSQEPTWNKKITVVLDAGCASVVIAIYNNGRQGKSHELIGWCTVPSHICLYQTPVERKYPLLRTDGTPLKVKVMDAASHKMMQKQALVHVSWKIRVPVASVAAGDSVFIPPGSGGLSIPKGLTGKYNKRWIGGASYYGSWQDGVPHGQGKYISEEATEYDGEWSWSKMHGQGCFKFSNGDVYRGTFKDNQRHGQGTCRAVNGDVYQGEWRFGLQHGRGRWETKDGMIYDGEWKENRAHGTGLVTEPDGQKWDGIFHEGLVLRRNDARPPTPRNINKDTQFEVVPMHVASVDQRTISSMIHRQTNGKNWATMPTVYADSWNVVKVYKGDVARYDEDPRDIHKCFWQRNEKILETAPQVQLEIQRTETEIDERLLRRETKKDLVKAQYANAEAEKRASKEAEDGTKKSSVCVLS